MRTHVDPPEVVVDISMHFERDGCANYAASLKVEINWAAGKSIDWKHNDVLSPFLKFAMEDPQRIPDLTELDHIRFSNTARAKNTSKRRVCITARDYYQAVSLPDQQENIPDVVQVEEMA